MIYDKVENITRYLGLSKALDEAIFAIIEGKIKDRQEGKNVLSENVFFNYPGKILASNVEGMDYEYHQTYIDIHLALEGEERIAFFAKENGQEVKAYDADGDYGLYKGQAENILRVAKGEFLILFPGEIHLALMKGEGEAKEMEKIIFKVRASKI